MKKILIIIFLLIPILPVIAENNSPKPAHLNNLSTIDPQKLTSKETKNYIAINKMAKKAFINIILKLDTTSFPSNINELCSPPIYSDNNLFTVSKVEGLLTYIFDKDTGNLSKIELQQNKVDYPSVVFTYNYPAGDLVFVNIKYSSAENFFYNPNGEYINLNDYIIQLSKKVKCHWKAKLHSTPILPFYKFDASLKTIINFKVNKNGELIDYRINIPSGIDSFDKLAIQSLKESLPAGKIPEKINIDDIEVYFTFDYNVRGNKKELYKDYNQLRQNKIILSNTKLSSLKTDYSDISNNELIWLSLDLIKNSKFSSIINSLLGDNNTGSQMPIKIYFKDLSKYGKVYENFDGLGWKVKNNCYIYINEKHINAPPEAIACLIARLEVHQDEKDSLNEEMFATMREVELWNELIKSKPELIYIPNSLVSRENILLEKYKQGNYTDTFIKEMIYSHPYYKFLPISSPGF